MTTSGKFNNINLRSFLLCKVETLISFYIRLYPSDLLVLDEDSGYDDSEYCEPESVDSNLWTIVQGCKGRG